MGSVDLRANTLPPLPEQLTRWDSSDENTDESSSDDEMSEENQPIRMKSNILVVTQLNIIKFKIHIKLFKQIVAMYFPEIKWIALYTCILVYSNTYIYQYLTLVIDDIHD